MALAALAAGQPGGACWAASRGNQGGTALASPSDRFGAWLRKRRQRAVTAPHLALAGTLAILADPYRRLHVAPGLHHPEAAILSLRMCVASCCRQYPRVGKAAFPDNQLGDQRRG